MESIDSIYNRSVVTSTKAIQKKGECCLRKNRKAVRHHCNRSLGESKAVKCKEEKCENRFCRRCLVRYYKYSKEAARMLPSATWKCPKCTSKCVCLRLPIKNIIGVTLNRRGGRFLVS
jgi:hypothetical protein